MHSAAFRDLAYGAAAGQIAGHIMDRATTRYYATQSEASKEREIELAENGNAPALMVRNVAGKAGLELAVPLSERIALATHRAVTTAYGVAAAALVRRGVPPVRAGLLTGAGAFLAVDEGMGVMGLVAPARAYPRESHVRGVVGHAVLGAAIGGMLRRRVGNEHV